MTTTISQTLIITATTTRGNELQKKYNNKNCFVKVISLDNLVLELFEIYDDSSILIDNNIATTIIHKLIQNGKSDYFKYLGNNAQSLKIIYDLFLKLQLNDIKIEELNYEDQKQKALKDLITEYKRYLKSNSLVDSSGVVNIGLRNINKYLKKFDEVLVDSFKVDKIDLIKSKKHKELVDKIKKNKLSKSLRRTLKDNQPNLYQNKAFNSYDEVRIAIKISKKLMLNGSSEDDIIIVCNDLNEYLPYYYNLLDEYGMKGYDTVGVPLNSYGSSQNSLKNHTNFKVQKAYWKYKESYEKIVSLSKYLNLAVDKIELEKILLQNSMVRGDKIGVLFTDPNKFIGSQKRYKHIIFIGSDITHFPPKAKDNFLFTQSQAQKLFYINNVYEASDTLYNELKKLSDNLYIITATYKEKRKLSPSIIIDKDIKDEFKIDDILSRNEIIKNKNRVEDKELESYQKSISATEFTSYDGKDLGIFIQGDKLSASALNTYQKCPMRYYFNTVLKLKAPQDEQDGFDAAQKGRLMHKCFELFVENIKNINLDKLDLIVEKLYPMMYDTSIEAYNCKEIQQDIKQENINHKIDLVILQNGLDTINTNKGELAKFVDYFIENEFGFFKKSNIEELFMLDSDFKITTDDTKRFIKGYIDRVDCFENDLNIIDYKSSVKRYTKSTFKFKDGKLEDFQLGIYMLYAKQQYKAKSYNAHLLSFKDKQPNKSYFIDDKIYNDEYESMMKNQILQIKDDINSGKFEFNNSDEKVCEYCDYRYICHQGVLDKELKNESIN